MRLIKNILIGRALGLRSCSTLDILFCIGSRNQSYETFCMSTLYKLIYLYNFACVLRVIHAKTIYKLFAGFDFSSPVILPSKSFIGLAPVKQQEVRPILVRGLRQDL